MSNFNNLNSLTVKGPAEFLGEVKFADKVLESSIEDLNYSKGLTGNIQEQLNYLRDNKSEIGHDHKATEVSGLSAVATSGSYGDLIDRPKIPSIEGLATEAYVNTQINNIEIPKYLSDFTDDVSHRLVTDIEKTNWNLAKVHADSAHAPVEAEKNQNAFSTIKVGNTNVSANTATDILTLEGSNVTITPDTTNDKITFTVADGNTSTKGIVKLTNSTSSTSTTTAATPSSVKAAYDLANQAKTIAEDKADSDHTHSLGSFGITATVSELSYSSGLTSNIQSQLNSKSTIGKKGTGENSEIFNNYINNVASGRYSHAEGDETVASSDAAHAEGRSTTAEGSYSHAEGCGTIAGGCSHAEGKDTIARSGGHAEGDSTEATGMQSHAEGHFSKATYNAAHAEGVGTLASAHATHSEGMYTRAMAEASHCEGLSANLVDITVTTSTTADDIKALWDNKRFSCAFGKGSHAEGSNTLALGDSSHSEGSGTIASGSGSHAEGGVTTASGSCSHAEGTNTTASGDWSHAEGWITTASGGSAHTEGSNTTASGSSTHAEGSATTASGDFSHSEGWFSEATNYAAHAEGYDTLASGSYSHAEGDNTVASGTNSHAEGYGTCATNYASHAGGKYNKPMEGGGGVNAQVGDVFVIGNGQYSNNSNAFRITYTGTTYGLTAFNSSGADYAEFVYPWFDDNTNNEDRIGYFVTFKEGKLYKATSKDTIIGVTSGNPSVVGNADEDYYWRYERDEFNRIVFEDVEEETQKVDNEGNLVLDENGKPIMEKTGNIIKNGKMKLSENYDPALQNSYIERKNRQEWDYVGMLGVIPIRDDGTCLSGQYCKCNDDGIATLATTEDVITNRFTYTVLERVSDNVIKVLMTIK